MDGSLLVVAATLIALRLEASELPTSFGVEMATWEKFLEVVRGTRVVGEMLKAACILNICVVFMLCVLRCQVRYRTYKL